MLGAMRHLRVALPRVAPRRNSSSMIDGFYRNFLKSNVSHVTFVVTGAIIFELIYGKATEALWDYANAGVRLKSVDFVIVLSRRNSRIKSTGRRSARRVLSSRRPS